MSENTQLLGANFLFASSKAVGDLVRGDVIYVNRHTVRQVWAVSAFHLVGALEVLLDDGSVLLFSSESDTVRVIEDGQ